jgi:hypothetical protein
MNLLKKITMFRVYLAVVIVSLSAFTFAEYYGYELLGSDESSQSVRSHGSGSSVIHHK